MQLDYEIADVLELTTPEQLKALGDAFRQKILLLLLDGAATTQQLAEVLNAPTSTVAHHLQVLTEAGLTRVVSTRQVRALTQKYFGRTARSYVSISHEATGDANDLLNDLFQTLKEIAANPERRSLSYQTGHARISPSQVQAFSERLDQLIQEFEISSTTGEEMYTLMAVLYHARMTE